MTPETDGTSAREIEADLEQTRSGLASDLDALSQRASIDYIAREALGMLKINSSDATRSIDRAMRSNPAAFALIGLGAAALVFTTLGGGARSSSATGRGPQAEDPNPDWHMPLGDARDKARSALARLEEEARASVGSLQSKLSDQVDQVRDFAAERARVIEEFTTDLRHSMAEGLDHLTESARDQVMAARRHSYAAWLRAERLIKGGSREVVTLVEEHPIAAGAAALAVGAMAGVLLMRSGTADRNSPAAWTGGGSGRAARSQGSYRGGWAQGSSAGLTGMGTGGGGSATSGGQRREGTGGAGLYGGSDANGSVPPM